MPEAKDNLINSTLSHFRIESKLGEGGMGRVYRATDLRLRRPVALKLLSPALIQDEKALKHFQIEAVAASSNNHPNICTIYEIDTVGPNTFIAMEFVDGQTLGEWLAEKSRLPQSDVLTILEQVCAAMACAHENGIVHQDIKPDNIMISSPQNTIKVMDFGLAKLASDTATKEAGDAAAVRGEDAVFVPDLVTTTFSGLVGTAAYMSPEQAKRETVDHRTDIYSLGVMTYELLTGQKPFSGDSHIKVLENIVNNPPPGLQRKGLYISTKWIPIIRRCMEKEPGDRYQSIEELQHDLAGVGKSLKSNRGALSLFQRFSKKSAFKIVLPAAFVFVLALFAVANYSHVFHYDKTATHGEQPLPVTTTSKEAYQYFLAGQKAWWRYDMRAAMNSFQMAVEADNSFAYAQVLLGVLLRWQDRDKDMKACRLAAENVLDKLSGWEKQLVQGFIYYFDDKNNKMKDAFLRAIELDSTRIDCYLGASLAFERLKDYDSAIMVTNKVIDLDSTHIAAYGNLSDLNEWKGDIKNAKRCSEKQLQLILASDNRAGAEGVFESLGRFSHYLADDSAAVAYLARSLELDPRNRDASQALAEVYALGGHIEKAERVLQTALSMPLKPQERVGIYRWYSALMTFSGQWVNAIEHLEKARRLYEQFDDQIGICYCIKNVCDIYFEMNQTSMIENEMQRYAPQPDAEKKEKIDCLPYYQINMALALKDENFILAQNWVDKFYEYSNKKRLESLEASLALARGQYATVIKLISPIIAKDRQPFWGDYLQRRYLVAYSQFKAGLHDEAIETCQLALQARHILMFNSISLYSIKTIALLSEIYETMGQVDLSLAECDRFFMHWKNADPGIPLLVEMQTRRERLKQKDLSS